MEPQLQEINCPICMMTFKKPITISCGHTFCYSCLSNSLREHRNCPICRQHVTSMPNKIRVDESIQLIIDQYRRAHNKLEINSKKQILFTECKTERLLLIDVATNDLLLPFNKITATFELQSNSLIDRMERFVARQEPPFNKYSTLCKLVHIEQIRKNLYKGTLQGQAFCCVQSEEVESELSLEGQDEEYFYRTCKCKEISESSNISPAQFQFFFTHFDKIEEQCLNKLIFLRVDRSVFMQRNDPIALFYSILGIIKLSNQSKYTIATSFDQQKRLAFIKDYLTQNQRKIISKPSTLVHIPIESGLGDKKILLIFFFFVFVYLIAQSQDL